MRGVCEVSACLEMLVLPSTSPQFPSDWLLPLPLADLVIFYKPGTDAFDVPSLLSLHGSCSTSPVPFITALTNSSRA